jgi:hypothetical protein
MKLWKRYAIFLGAFAPVMLTGCMPKMTIEEMKAMRPERPAELSRLDQFVGNWVGKGEAKMAGIETPMTTSGRSEVQWGLDGWMLVEHGTYSMGELGEMNFHSFMTYDIKGRKYRSAWADSMGGYGTGTLRYNEKTDTWHMKAKSTSPFGNSTGKGTVRFVDDRTQEWTWNERAFFGLFKVMEMSGTATKQ